MKRLLLSSLILGLAVFTASAQPTTKPQTSAAVYDTPLQAGNWLVGAGVGSTGYNFSTKTYTLNIQPRAGYFVRDNVAIGARVNLGIESSPSVNQGTEAAQGGTRFNYGITPFARYYFNQASTSTGRFFGEGEFGIGGSSKKNSQKEEPITLILGVSAGYAHFITRTVALEGTLGYTYSKANISSGATGSGSSGLNVGFGFQIYLPGRTR